MSIGQIVLNYEKKKTRKKQNTSWASQGKHDKAQACVSQVIGRA